MIQMKITTITVHAARGFNHPYEQYSNFKPGLSLTAELLEGEDVDKTIAALQAKAEKACEDLKTNILADLEATREMGELAREAHNLEEALQSGTARLAAIRARHPNMKFGQLQIGASGLHPDPENA